MSTTTGGLPLMAQTQSQRYLTYNELAWAVTGLQSGVISRSEFTPPGSPSEGDAYIVAATATGAWATHENDIAFYFSGIWNFLPPEVAQGNGVYVIDEDLRVRWDAIGSPPGYVELYEGDASGPASSVDGVVALYDGTSGKLLKSTGTAKIPEALQLTADITPSQITANTDDYNPTGLSTASTLRLSTDASRNLTGIQGGADGRILLLHNVGSFDLVLKDDTTSTAANRFQLSTDVTLAADQSTLIQYDATSSRWRVIGGVGSGGGGSDASAITYTPADNADWGGSDPGNVDDALDYLAANLGGGGVGGITLAAAQATTSGTSKDFTIPAGTKKITVMLSGVSTNGTSVPIIQLGDSGGIETTGYDCCGSGFGSGVGTAAYTTGFAWFNTVTAAYAQSGAFTLTLEDSTDNTWTFAGVAAVASVPAQGIGSGKKSLSGELTTIRLTTVNGTDAFDAGEVSVLYHEDGGAGSGAIVQVKNFQTGAVATGTTLVPLDDTIPQNTEGDEYMTLAITPTSATNILKIDVVGFFSSSAGSIWHATSLFQDSTANALATAVSFEATATAVVNTKFTHYMVAGTTSATTFKVRSGGHGAGTVTFNGAAGARRYGGMLASSITITEIVP